MAKLYTEEYFKARVGDLLFYRLNDMMVLRTISGFTKETRNTQSKYENCTRSANEFGRVSAACKQIRVALYGILPKQNNLAVVNSFTKKMREVLEHDSINERGERQLANALATEKGRQLLKGYEFNPDTKITIEYAMADDNLSVTIDTNGIAFPKGAKCIGFRAHQLVFDFATGASELVSGEWVMESKTGLRRTVVLDLPGFADANGVVFMLLEIEFYGDVGGDFVPMIGDGGKSVGIVEIR